MNHRVEIKNFSNMQAELAGTNSLSALILFVEETAKDALLNLNTDRLRESIKTILDRASGIISNKIYARAHEVDDDMFLLDSLRKKINGILQFKIDVSQDMALLSEMGKVAKTIARISERITMTLTKNPLENLQGNPPGLPPSLSKKGPNPWDFDPTGAPWTRQG